MHPKPQLFPLSRTSGIDDAIDRLSRDGSIEERGAVFTAPPVVTAILDLANYISSFDLHTKRLLEPSFGAGDFLLPAIERLLDSFENSGNSFSAANTMLGDAICAVELHKSTFESTKSTVIDLLVKRGITRRKASNLASNWMINDDFLLTNIEGNFDCVVGNPPYVRPERIPSPLLQEYRRIYSTMFDRADIYVPFYERALGLLRNDGTLAYICANRWNKNKYGGPLRALISKTYHLTHYIDLVGVPAFSSEVIAYPAITVIRKDDGRDTLVSSRPSLEELPAIANKMTNSKGKTTPKGIVRVSDIARGRDPWLLDSLEQLALIRKIESRHPTIENDKCRVGIGVATGCDKVYIAPYDTLPVEESRKLPLAMAKDLRGCEIHWNGMGVLNPYESNGTLANLDDYPKFRSYLNRHKKTLSNRHVAKKDNLRWYRTIDRIYSELTMTPKLLIPDIKGGATVAYDPGGYYPHHNLYHITSEHWELRALQAILRSSISVLFVASYGVRMNGGYLRFQAQYLRRICVPEWNTLNRHTRGRLLDVSGSDDLSEIDDIVLTTYNLTSSERKTIKRIAAAARVNPPEA